MKDLTKIVNRHSGGLVFEAEVESESASVRLGLAAQLALKVGANLTDADLGDAYLGGADLGDANLTGANLKGADLGD